MGSFEHALVGGNEDSDRTSWIDERGYAELASTQEANFEADAGGPKTSVAHIDSVRIRVRKLQKTDAEEIAPERGGIYKRISAEFEKTLEKAEQANIQRLVSEAANQEIKAMKQAGLLNPAHDTVNPKQVRFTIRNEQIRQMLCELGYIDEAEASGDLTTALAARLLGKPIGHLVANKSTRYYVFETLQGEAQRYLYPRETEEERGFAEK